MSTLTSLLGQLPPPAARALTDAFTVDGVTTTTANGVTLHRGTLRSARSDPLDLGFGTLEVPGITSGTPFRLAEFDAPAGRWHLDLVLDGLRLTLKDLHGADFVKESGTTPRRLIRKATDTAVVIAGEATLRLAQAQDGAPLVFLFVDTNAADPLADSGAVVHLRCTPPHFFFGSSEFGLTLSELLFDASATFSPPYIVAQGQTPAWMGFAIAEATFYAPPNAIGRGGFSGGVRNLLIGAPRGLQGEFEVQWGRAPLDPTTFSFTQQGHAAVGAAGSGNAFTVAITGSQDDAVPMAAAFVASSPPEGGAVTDWQATWRWPDGHETLGDVASGTVAHGDVLRVTPEEHVAGRAVIRHPEISFRFVAAGEVPEIDVITAGTSVVHAVHVAGPAAEIAALQFRARSTAPAAGSFSWKLGAQGAVQTGIACQLPLAEVTGDQFLVLTETVGTQKRLARVRVQVQAGEPLLVGGVDGVVRATAPAVALQPLAVEGTFDLPDFQAKGEYRTVVAEAARLDSSLAPKVKVPEGTLAVVTLEPGGAAPVPTPAPADRHVAIEFEFANGVPLRWSSTQRPVGVTGAGDAANLHAQLLAWAARYPGAQFLAVGRCDDLGSPALNATLAHARRDTVRKMLTTVPADAASDSALAAIDAARITAWGEQDGQPATVATSPLDSEERAAQRLILAADDVTGLPLVDRDGWPTQHNTAHACEPVRSTYRRVDVYAVGGTPAAGSTTEPVAAGRRAALRRMQLPGVTRDPVPALASTPSDDARVKLLVGWDKPTGQGWVDLIPSKAEFEYAWSPASNPPPALAGEPVAFGTEVLTVYGSWKHDDASGFTRAQLGIRSDGDPDGLFRFNQPNLVAALALGPMMLSGVKPGTDTIEKAGRIAALAAGTAFAKVDLGGGPLLGAGSKAVIQTIEAATQFDSLAAPGDGYKISLVSDYATTLHVHGGVLGLSTAPDHPVKIRYRKVGIEFDSSKSNVWERIGLAYPTDALEIEDPGRWKIDGALGKLLRAIETALGISSLWIETRFAVALNAGVVEISEAAIRLTFTPPDVLPAFSLRGLVAKVDIPATVKGEGRLRIEDPGGVIKAGLDLELIPLKLKASAAFAMAQIGPPQSAVPYTFVNLFLKVQFPVGIPLASSGAALYGFIGQTVINGERAVTADPDVVKREIGWWGKKPEDKYRPRLAQHALGIGAVVGTLPDASFSVSATGMIVVAFPDPEVIFGVEVSLLKVPDKTAKEKGGNQNASIIGLIVIDDTAVTMAVQARYEIPKILSVRAPIAAYFPYSGHGIYVRLGSDGQMGRSGEPITLTLLPDTLNLQAFSYLMIEQDGLPSLGGRPDFSFDGFSVGFGAGAALEWKAGPIRLSASVLLLAGFGTDPLLIKAGIFVKGALDLVVISVEARGQIVLTYQNGDVWMDGEFCGKVDFFFFSVEGCVRFRIGSPTALLPADPLPPVASVMLTDRGGRIMGEATADAGALKALPIFQMSEVAGALQNTGADPKDNQTVWADTAPVLNFRHFIQDAIPDGQQFNPRAQPSGEIWFGSNRLKYTYRLDAVRLVRAADGAVVSGSAALESVWMTSPARQPGSAGPNLPSGAEVQSLKLLDWQPWGWALPMSDGGAGVPGDPAQTVATVCDPVPAPARACLYGADARDDGPHRIRLLQETPAAGPYPSRFTLSGFTALPQAGGGWIDGLQLAALVATMGGALLPGAVVALPQAVTPQGPTQPAITQGYRLPEAQLTTASGLMRTALPWRAQLSTTVRRARLLLMVCDGVLRPPKEARTCFGLEPLKIGQRGWAFDLPAFSVASRNRRSLLNVTDRVSLSQGNATLGADQQADLMFGAAGVELTLKQPARSIELSLFRPEGAALEVAWKDRSGGSQQRVEAAGAPGALLLRLDAPDDLAQITLISKSKATFLYRVCLIGAVAGEQCVDLRELKREQVADGGFQLQGVTFKALDAPGFGLLDVVDLQVAPPAVGRDGLPELRLPDKGTHIELPQPAASVTLGLLSKGSALGVRAFDEHGTRVAQAKVLPGQPETVALAAPSGIARLLIEGGANEAVLFRLCHRALKAVEETPRRPEELGRLAAAQRLPFVTTQLGDKPPQVWTPTLLGSVATQAGDGCRIMAFDQPDGVLDADHFAITTPPGWRVTLLSLCAVDTKAALASAADQQARDALRDAIITATVSPIATAARPVLLEPGTEYRVEVDWSWQAWQSNEAGTDSPPPVPTGSWKAGARQDFRFRIADEDLNADGTQDGLNEYRFDPRDLARYLARTEPADGRDTVFTDDPLWMHFDTGHVLALAERYGRELKLEVRRTDPPPQPDAVSMEVAIWPVHLQTLHVKAPLSIVSMAEQRIAAAAEAAPCIPDGGSPVGGASLGARFALAPNAMYDFNLIAPKKGVANPALADPVVVKATRFVTSRYANPQQMVEALGFATGTGQVAPFVPQERLLAADVVLPSGALQVSDVLMDEALALLGLDTLPPADAAARVIALWRPTTPGHFGVIGFLIDAPEPLRRERAVLQGQSAVDSLRCAPEALRLRGASFIPVRATRNWTRVLFAAAVPVQPVNDDALELRVAVTPGGLLSGWRRINARPLVLDVEGF